MCGIFAGLSKKKDLRQIMYEALFVLQNRGYDSCGFTLCSSKDHFSTYKTASVGDRDAIEFVAKHIKLEPSRESYTNAMLHVRWATHGAKETVNAHPVCSMDNRYFVVHNGIISNYSDIKDILIKKGYQFYSETDTEDVSALVYMRQKEFPNETLIVSFKQVIKQIEGTYAIILVDMKKPESLFVAKCGSPLLFAHSSNEDTVFLASESAAFSRHASQYMAIDDHSVFQVSRTPNGQFMICNDKCFFPIKEFVGDKVVDVEHIEISTSPAPFNHWTEKEIFEQNEALLNSLNHGGRLFQTQDNWKVKLGGLQNIPNKNKIKHIILTGCGSSFHACLFAQRLFRKSEVFETVQCIEASDFELDDVPNVEDKHIAFIVVSQSGETRDLIRMLEELDDRYLIIGVTNGVSSCIARKSTCGVYLNAGREQGVASTKAFTCQVMVLQLLCMWFSQQHDKNINVLASSTWTVPQLFKRYVSKFNEWSDKILPLIENKKSLFILGKGVSKSIAFEGALKIKEISYQNAEGFSAGAMKHGVFALIDHLDKTPVFILVWKGKYRDLMLSSCEEIKSRGGRVIVMTNDQSLMLHSCYDQLFMIDAKNEFSAALLSVLLFQLIAYKLSVKFNHNPDKPRNLAKCVTVD